MSETSYQPLLPDSLFPFQKGGEALFKEGAVSDLLFSSGTYQVQTIDPEFSDKEIWSFLQFDAENHLQDSFCSCSDNLEIGCVHQAAAYFRVYNGHKKLLHTRYRESLWRSVSLLITEKFGYDSDLLTERGDGEWAIVQEDGTDFFLLKAESEACREEIEFLLEEKERETEETSIKFSNLSLEEIQQWKRGRPSKSLLFELSFWADLARWMLMKQDRHEYYQITFEGERGQLPNQINVKFSDLTVSITLLEEEWISLIPSLGSVESNLGLFAIEENVLESIEFNQEEGVLNVHKRSEAVLQSDDEESLFIGNWRFVPEKGFYSTEQNILLDQQKIERDEVGEVLQKFGAIVDRYLVGGKVFLNPVELSYTLEFDSHWNLKISSHLFEKGDLTQFEKIRFGDWIFIEGKGFYPVKQFYFDQQEWVVAEKDLSAFISNYSSWLNRQEGFSIHLAKVEDRVFYYLAEEGTLHIGSELPFDEREEFHDFGMWVYIAQKGFYNKFSKDFTLPVYKGIQVEKEKVGEFIRENREDLSQISGFFSEENPIYSFRLRIIIDKERNIQITPFYSYTQQYKERDVKVFGGYAYVPGEGFSKIPIDQRIPEEFREKKIIPETAIAFFIEEDLEILRPFAREVDPAIEGGKEGALVLHAFKYQERSGKLLLKFSIENDIGSVEVTQLYSELQKRYSYLFTDAGLINLEDKRFEWIRGLPEENVDVEKGTVAITPIELIKLNIYDVIVPAETLSVQEKRAFSELVDGAFDLKRKLNFSLKGLKSELRSYQEHGVRWLWFLYEHSISGLLCDDMGLGKTHQTMALMAAIGNCKRKKKAQFLVICPTSVIYHWKDKLAEFLPHLKVATYHGSRRSLKEFKESGNLLLTSYGVWRNDRKELSSLNFDLAVFDEVQMAKNYMSLIHRSLGAVKAKMRLGLTGTPIENRLVELKALFDLVLPGYMPSEEKYRLQFVHPIEKEQDPSAKALLGDLIAPFILRRKKEDVLDDLPEKIEEVAHCPLVADQKDLYTSALNQSREMLVKRLEDRSQSLPYIHVFALLTQLKQICNHPAAYLKDPTNYKDYESGKWELFKELLGEARESEQKVVVFSQYLSMLDIMQLYLEEKGISYAQIRGSTRDRARELIRFNEDPECEVFLGSLQAVGLGVDLTAASVVIHYDRWWNAARENQATDRVHRIGQTRGVQVFKLVTTDSFEEKIDALITRKGQLMEEIVGVNDQAVLKMFSRDELIDLLA